MYKLPDQIGRQVTEQYARDVARVHGGPVVNEEAEYRKFMVDMGGAPPPELMGLDREGEWACMCSNALGSAQCHWLCSYQVVAGSASSTWLCRPRYAACGFVCAATPPEQTYVGNYQNSMSCWADLDHAARHNMQQLSVNLLASLFTSAMCVAVCPLLRPSTQGAAARDLQAVHRQPTPGVRQQHAAAAV